MKDGQPSFFHDIQFSSLSRICCAHKNGYNITVHLIKTIIKHIKFTPWIKYCNNIDFNLALGRKLLNTMRHNCCKLQNVAPMLKGFHKHWWLHIIKVAMNQWNKKMRKETNDTYLHFTHDKSSLGSNLSVQTTTVFFKPIWASYPRQNYQKQVHRLC